MEDSGYVIQGGRLVLPASVLEEGSIVVRDGHIEAVLEAGRALPADLPRLDVKGSWVSPGLIEQHIHGAGGMSFEDVSSEDPEAGLATLLGIRDFLAARGVTSFVPTVNCRDRTLEGLALALEASGLPESTVPGLYVEGPFVDPGHKGGIGPETLQAFDPRRLAELLDLARGRLRLMTYAPELSGAPELARLLEAAGVIPCLGHSGASLSGLALPQGKYCLTHLFNAMTPFSHKEAGAGLCMLPFIDRRPFVELNADGVHVNDEALLAAHRALEPGRLVLISDAASPAGLPPGRYALRDKVLDSGPRGVRYADSGVLMGSASLLPQVLAHWLRLTGASVPEALASCTLVPARLLGIDDWRGALLPGLEAALVVWEGDFAGVGQCLLPGSRPPGSA